MNPQQPNINALWAALMVEEFSRQGIDYYCISPGSRSTPLTVAAARHERVQTRIHVDERGSAFHALGYGRATGRPAVLICTSGTALANFHPAVIEAHQDHVPLIVLSADRPPELRHTGANQTIEQPDIFSTAVRWQVDLPCPSEDIPADFVLTTIAQAALRAAGPPAGPVHLNCMFREPLAPVPQPFRAAYTDSIGGWMSGRSPYTAVSPPGWSVSGQTLEQIAARLTTAENGIMVIGGLAPGCDRTAIEALAERLRWPVFADITSGLRLGTMAQRISFYDLRLLAALPPVDAVLHLGGRLVSKRFTTAMTNAAPAHYIHVDGHHRRQDPAHRVTWRIVSEPADFCNALGAILPAGGEHRSMARLRQDDRHIDALITGFDDKHDKLNEISVARAVSRDILPDSALFLASSMPVRDMDMFAAPQGPRVVVAANRGASGIDGTVASAAGFAAGLQRPTTVLIGDLALLHDLNSLAQLDSFDVPLIIIVINNHGGGIFSFLPVARETDVFEAYFGTPHRFHFEHAAAMFRLNYERPEHMSAFRQAYRQAQQRRDASLIEVVTDRPANYTQHQALQQAIIDSLNAQD